MLETVDTDVGGIGLVDEEATTVRGGKTVTLVEDVEVDILVESELLNSNVQEYLKALCCAQLCSLESDLLCRCYLKYP